MKPPLSIVLSLFVVVPVGGLYPIAGPAVSFCRAADSVGAEASDTPDDDANSSNGEQPSANGDTAIENTEQPPSTGDDRSEATAEDAKSADADRGDAAADSAPEESPEESVALDDEDFPGQSDLDEAMRLRVTANSMSDLERVIELGESALSKGLDEDTGLFAKQMLAASLLQHATQLAQDVLASEKRPATAYLRRAALKNLAKATEYDDELGEPYMLIARLEMMGGGDVERARAAADKAVERFSKPEQRGELANALVLRGSLREDKEKSMQDFSRALEIDANHLQALRARGILYAQQDQLEKALADFETLLKVDSENLLALQDIARILQKKEDHQQALKYINKALELAPNSPQMRLLRAQVRLAQNEIDLALSDLDAVIASASSKGKAMLLLSKARICLQQEEPEEAMRRYYRIAIVDLSEALRLRPGDEETLILRSLAYSTLEDYGLAIADIEALVRLNPDKIEFRLQLAAYLTRDQRPRKAIEVYDAILAKDEDQDRARLGRADALLSIGEHARAVVEYEQLLSREPQEVLDSVLNNLAWVLATSPMDDVRNGKRSVELARRACEITEFKQPHILSTLAAGYAEMQDFDQAIEWSRKAVDLGQDHRDIQQLKSELESYENKKPWREREEVAEKAAPDPFDAEPDALPPEVFE